MTTEALREQLEETSLRLQIAQQQATLNAINANRTLDKLESWYDPSNYVDLRDYLPSGSYTSAGLAAPYVSRVTDREDGDNLPILRNEQDLAEIRGLARVLYDWNEVAKGALNTLANYVVGAGASVRVTGANGTKDELAIAAQAVLDRFIDSNDFVGELDSELFIRLRRDGEYFLGLWQDANGAVAARVIEPEQVTEPARPSELDEWLGCGCGSWSWGVHSDIDDMEGVHGYFVQWSANPHDWDYLPGGSEPYVPRGAENCWVEHCKVNVDRKVKRGLSDFLSNHKTLQRSQVLLRNLGDGAALQAAIAWIRESPPGASAATIESGTMARADRTYTKRTDSGSRQAYVQQYDPGTVLSPTPGTKYTAPPAWAVNSPQLLGVFASLLRTAATRWAMPEYLISSDASNANYASALISESPFVKACESFQRKAMRSQQRIYWQVLRFAHRIGAFGDISWSAFQRAITLAITPPDVGTRLTLENTQRNQTLRQAGLITDRSWATREGITPEEQEEAAAQPKPVPVHPPEPLQRQESDRSWIGRWRNYP